jgi:hypothetical protein
MKRLVNFDQEIDEISKAENASSKLNFHDSEATSFVDNINQGY